MSNMEARLSERFILTVNAGSSSIKFKVFAAGESSELILNGQVERIGNSAAQLVVKNAGTAESDRNPIQAETHQDAARSIAEYIHHRFGADAIAAIGHRVVHGGIR